MDGSWRPIATSHFIQHGSTDADTGISFKACTLRGVIILNRFDQAYHPGLNQILDLYIRWQTPHEVIGDFLYKRRIPDKGLAWIRIRCSIHSIPVHLNSLLTKDCVQ